MLAQKSPKYDPLSNHLTMAISASYTSATEVVRVPDLSMQLTTSYQPVVQLKSKLQDEHYYSRLIRGQKCATISPFTLESGQELQTCQIAYKTWGKLNEARDNVLVVCHALTGSSDLVDWWHPLLGPGKALDPSRYFIFCANCLGSPYGSSSPLSRNPATNLPYGPEFPSTTFRDDVL